MVTLLSESRYNLNGTLVAAHGGVATPWNSGRAIPRRAWMHQCCGHMDVQERPLPCTTNERTLHAVQLIFLNAKKVVVKIASYHVDSYII
jgi:hypothetical protein